MDKQGEFCFFAFQMRNTYLILLFLIPTALFSQEYKVTGKVTNDRMEPLSYVSIQTKTDKVGVITAEDGTYELNMPAGENTLYFTMIGYEAQVVQVVISKNELVNIILRENKNQALEEVVVRSKLRDRSLEIIKNVIQHKDSINALHGDYSCKVYIKAVQYDSSLQVQQFKDSLKNSKQQFTNMALTEVMLQQDNSGTSKIKEERLGVTKRGKQANLFYLSTTEGDFSLYNNLITAPALSQISFISPLSYSGLMAYKFKTIKIDRTVKPRIYTISFKPRQVSNATFEGIVTVQDSTWVILSTTFELPKYHLPEYDYFSIEQSYQKVKDTAWMLSRQSFTYISKMGKKAQSGNTVATYNDYELKKVFPKNYFGVEVSSTTAQAYKADSSFWNKVRTEPLSKKEIDYIRYTDSIYRYTHTQAYYDSVDKITNKITLKKLLLTGPQLYNREKRENWYLPSLASFIQPFSFGGFRISPGVYFTKSYPTEKDMGVYANLSYGVRNKDLNGTAGFSRTYNTFNKGYYRVNLGKNFQYIYNGDAWVNMLKRSNVYLNNSVGVGHGIEIFNGFFVHNYIEMAFRRSVKNYKYGSLTDSLFNGSGWLDNNVIQDFDPYNALYGSIRFTYTPAQRYIREPLQKTILGSKWPTFFLSLRKGVPNIFKSKVNFDYVEAGVEQTMRLGTIGVSKYEIKTGSFVNTTDLKPIDYHYQRRGDPIIFYNPHEAFQALDSTFPVFKRFYQGHYVHEFNGLLLNKIPLFKKLELREVGGGGFLVAPERNLRYGELFAGVERVFKWPFAAFSKFKLGVYVVSSASNLHTSPVQFKVGLATWNPRTNKWN